MLGKLLAGHYRVIQKLGEGGFGETYIVEDIHLPGNPRCVLKHLKTSSDKTEVIEVARRLFNQEAKTLQKLGKHDQIPLLMAYFEEDKQFYLVQELIVGHSLDREITPGKQLSESYTIALLENILEPLTFVHQNQVVHRDIKPPNLIRRTDGRIVLIDFGAVKEIAATKVVTGGRTQLTVAIGTVGYMPSEQARGRPRFSSDIFAVGIMGIQALTGKMPEQLTEDIDTGEIIWRHYVTGISPELLDILDRMVRYDFRQRYRSAPEALQAVRQLSGNSAPHPTVYDQPLSPHSQSNPLPSAYSAPTVPSQPPSIPHSPPPVPPQYRQEIPEDLSPSVAPSPQPQHLVSQPKPWLKIISQAEWGLILQWLLANVTGGVMSMGVGLSTGPLIYNALTLDNSIVDYEIAIVIACLVAGTLGGLILGLVQGLVLRKKIYPLKRWILATSLGSAMGLSIMLYLIYNQGLYEIPGITFATAMGCIPLGISQWFILRQKFAKSGRWVLVIIAVISINMAIYLRLYELLYYLFNYSRNASIALSFSFVSTLFSIITGICLVGILRNPKTLP